MSVSWQLLVCATAAQLVAPPTDLHAAQSRSGSAVEIGNESFRLAATSSADGTVMVRLEDRRSGFLLADGPCIYRASKTNAGTVMRAERLSDPTVKREGRTVVIRGKLLGQEIAHAFTLPRNKPWMEERVTVRNPGAHLASLSEFEVGMTRLVRDSSGQVLPDLLKDRWVAVPMRARATDPKGRVNDFSIDDLVTKPGYEPRVNKDQQYSQVPSRHRHSEGWAWTHGDHTLGIFSFNQENMVFSVVSVEQASEAARLRFGGACMISGEPAALWRIAPRQLVDLGVIRYESLEGGYTEAAYAYRSMLDEKGCHFPKGYNPPVHWEQLYDMPEAWNDRAHRYTKAIVEREAAKGRDYSCEALYLDPGWDTDFGTFRWGEQWLGPRKQFIQEMQSKYGLKVSLHCPLATWMSHEYSWGLGAVKTWPQEATRVAPEAVEDQTSSLQVPAVRESRRNLALLPEATPKASSVFANGGNALHQVAHLNDGWFGNSASWIAGEMPAWAEIDLGGVYEVSEVRLGNDHAQRYQDRAATGINVLVATNYAAESDAPSWHCAATSEGEPLQAERIFRFAPTAARWVRVQIQKAGPDMPRLDEIEVYESKPVSVAEGQAFAKAARRGPKPAASGQKLGPLLCLGSRQYRDEAEKRLLENCADGVVFLMFDGNWWNGGCLSTNHGHPVPYRIEDHTRANLDLAQRVHRRYPKVLIEMHDTVAGGSPARVTPVYYKYGLPGSYDENWGFELMWDPLADLREARGRSLYYYNLGCNVPIYLHIDLRNDNENCVVLWWFASTCRHLGIGGTSPKPAVVAAQKQAMKRYRELDRFFKRGEFYGISEEIHLHVLPREHAFVVNLFNLSDEKRTIRGSIALRKLGLDPNRSYSIKENDARIENGVFYVSREMEPWSTQLIEAGLSRNQR